MSQILLALLFLLSLSLLLLCLFPGLLFQSHLLSGSRFFPCLMLCSFLFFLQAEAMIILLVAANQFLLIPLIIGVGGIKNGIVNGEHCGSELKEVMLR